MTNYISQTEFEQKYPEIDLSQYSDITISGFISIASKYIDNFCNIPDGLVYENISDEKAKSIITNEGDLQIFPRNIPVNDVSSIKLKRGTWDLTLTLTSSGKNIYDIPSSGQYIFYPNTFLTAVGTFTMRDLRNLRGYDSFSIITYSKGYQTMPESIKDACGLLVKDILSRKMNQAGAKSISQGGISMTYFDRKGGKSDNVQDAENLLQPYKRVVPV